jgi:V8-like Glu-specific endopeptidase
MTFRKLASILILAGGCRGGVVTPATPEQNQAIVGGTEDVDTQGHVLDPTVGMLSVFQNGAGVGWACTTTLVAPRVLLTAGHCVRDDQSGQIIDGTNYDVKVGFGLHPDQENQWHKIVSADTNYQGSSQDIAVLILDQPITNVAPIALPPSTNGLPAVGGAIRIVGYGVTLGDRNDAGTKRQVTTTFNGAESDVISVGEFGGTEQTTRASCFGDSGGPTFYNGTIIGVTSYGLDQQCLQGSFMTNVSMYVDWVNQEIAANGGGAAPPGNPPPSNPPPSNPPPSNPPPSNPPPGNPPPPSTPGVCNPDEQEPNDSEGLANAICAGGDIVGICSDASDVDVYTFTASPGQTYDVVLAAPGGYQMTLYKVANGSRSLIDQSSSDGNTPAEIAHSTTTGGTYFVHVEAPTNDEPGVYYTLHLDVQ